MKTLLLTTALAFAVLPTAYAEDDDGTPTYEACFKMMETALKAQSVMLQAETDALANPRNVPVTVPNAANDAAAKRIMDGVTIKVDPANPTATPQIEMEHYPLDGDGDEEDDDAQKELETPPVVTQKELCKTLYGIAIE
ncbi:MAG: hypothetical protein GC134_04560 [Proteobacteria bacterium]|nr:hypothetical protein [Pseudomonadota bacterium]